jgi:hypothetical protein
MITAEQEAKWRAEEDARTLAEANVIRKDPGRLDKAKEAARKIADEERKRANAMSAVGKERKTKQSTKTQRDTSIKRQPYNVFQKI